MEIRDLDPVFPGTGFFIDLRLKNRSRTWAKQADFTSIDLRVVRESDHALIQAVTLTVSAVIYDTLQSWDKDKIGYNFSYPTLAAHTPVAETGYLFKFRFVPTSGDPYYEVLRVKTLKPKHTD